MQEDFLAWLFGRRFLKWILWKAAKEAKYSPSHTNKTVWFQGRLST